MYQHICTGAECPHCSPFAIGHPIDAMIDAWKREDHECYLLCTNRGVYTCIKCRKYICEDHTYYVKVSATTVYYVCAPCGSQVVPRMPHHSYNDKSTPDAILAELEQRQNHRERLRTIRDSCGHAVATWPKALRPSATVILVHGSHWQEGEPWEVLCQQRADNGWWGFPGGAVDIGESLEACAKREVKEETDLDIYLYGAVCVDSDPTQYAVCTYPDGCIQYVNITFLAGIVTGVPRASEESLALQWCRTDALPQPFLKNHAWRLAQAMAHRGPFFPVR